MDFITVEERKIPVSADVDIFIAGGGPAGVGAAIQGARAGAKVFLAEKLYALGGTLTSGLMSKIAVAGMTNGLPIELIRRFDEYRGTHYLKSRPEVPVDPETCKIVLDEMVIRECGVDVHFGTVVGSVVKEGNAIKAVTIHNLDGESAVRAKYYIDCTGDGQLGFLSGAECMVEGGGNYSSSPTLMFRIGNADLEALFRYEEEHPELFGHVYTTYKRHMMGPELCRENIAHEIYAHMSDFVKLIHLRTSEHPDAFTEEEKEVLLRRGILLLSQPEPGHVLVNSTSQPEFTGDSEREVSKTMADLRRDCHTIFRFAKMFIPGFENAFLMDTASLLGIRESRRIRGDYVLTQEDVEAFRKFDDRISSNGGGVELHSGKANSLILHEQDGLGTYNVPYRAIIAKGFTNLLVAGRCFSASHAALSAARNISFCCALGQAAGAAAAELSLSGKRDVRDADIAAIQEIVKDNL